MDMRSLIKDMIKPFKSASVCIWGGGGGEREGGREAKLKA